MTVADVFGVAIALPLRRPSIDVARDASMKSFAGPAFVRPFFVLGPVANTVGSGNVE
ncbi:hypothetical protein PTKU64_84590 [Paraburkholderia terrae]|uniref:Uncharacterized protein n=1 Tax=Paraburkholderia terrae TaxID=311230 RepID=A0ABM7U0L4_9BURK|nr:hypothetical protein PTKU64_84590 [Paraburkholderia terrae]